jgi:very-short-patch-repair endonuclease
MRPLFLSKLLTPEQLLEFQIKEKGLDKYFKREYRFHPKRKWRFDFACVEKQVAIEVEGGTWNLGRHVRPLGFEADCEKYNAATTLGWKVLRVTSKMVKEGKAIQYLIDLFND